MNKILLYLLMLPGGLWRALGADTEQLKAILSVKLKMDDRKPFGMGRSQSKKRKTRFTSTITFIVNFFVGFMYIFPMVTFKDPYMSLFGLYTMLMVLQTFGLITDFSSVLIDTRDKLIIFPKPVADRTIFVSRMLHIFIYFFRSVFPMSLAPWIVWTILHGWKGAMWFPVPMALLTFICLFLVLGCYLLLLKLAKPEKFKDIIGSFQILFSILLFITYYFMPRIQDFEALKHFTIESVSWIRFTPSYWLASCWYWVEPEKATLAGTAWFSILAILLPVVMLWVTVKFFAPSFIRIISAIDGIEVSPAKRTVRQAKRGSRYAQLANILNRNDASKAGFMATWLLTGRSRNFKMRVYPGFAYVPVYFIYLLTLNDMPLADVWAQLPETKKHLVILYMSGFVIMNAINFVTISEQYKAAWVYHSAPVKVPGSVLGGAFKAIWIKYFFPFISILGIFVVYVWGLPAILDVLLAMVNVTLFVVMMMRVNQRYLPFSIPEMIRSSGGKAVARIFFVFILMGGLGFGHYLASYFWWLKLLFLILSSIFLWLVWDSYISTSWENIKRAEDAL